MEESQIRSNLDEAVKRGATADQVRELYGRLQTAKPIAKKPSLGSAIEQDLGTIGKGIEGLIAKPLEDTRDVMQGKIKPLSPEMNAAALDAAMMAPGAKAIGSVAPKIAAVAPKIAAKAAPLAEKGLAGLRGETPAIKPTLLKQSKIPNPIDASRLELLRKGFHSRNVDQLEKAAGAMRADANADINAARKLGVVIGPQAMSKVVGSIKQELADRGLDFKTLHGSTLDLVHNLEKEANGGSLTLQRLEQYRQALRQVVRKNTTKLEGAGPEVPAALTAIDSIDDALDKLGVKDFGPTTPHGHAKVETASGPEAVKLITRFREKYARTRRFERVSDIISNAHGDATKLKNDLEKFMANAKNMAGFTSQEKAAMKSIASSSGGDKALRGAGTFGINTAKKNGNAFVPGIEMLASGGHAAPGILGGTVANLYRNTLTKGQAEKLLELIQNGGAHAAGQ